MARSLYARVASRGFPAVDFGGQTGQGASQSWGGGVLTWQDHGPSGAGTRGYDLAAGQSSRQFPAAQPGDAGLEWVNDAPMWGLPAGTRPAELPHAQTADAPPAGPRTPVAGHLMFGQYQGGVEGPSHAAPFPNLPMGSPWNHEQDVLYFEEENEVHGVNFGGHAARNDIPFLPDMPGWSHEPENEGGSTNLQPLSGPIRAQAGLDAVQGYGGGGPGPGGTNADKQYGYWRDESRQAVDIRPVMVNAAEIPFRTELPQMFTATDQTTTGPPVDYGYAAPTVNMIPQAPYEPPPVASGGPLPAGQPAWAGSFWS